MKRRELLTGAAATAVIATLGGTSVRFGISSALAQGGPEYTYMAPSRITLYQSYLLIAENKGYFKDEGLSIKIQPGTNTVVAVQQVAAGAAAFGMAAPISTCAPVADQKAPIDGQRSAGVTERARAKTASIASETCMPSARGVGRRCGSRAARACSM